MSKMISAANANREFSRLLRLVRSGRSVIITSHGTPVAKMAPIDAVPELADARSTLIARLRSQPVVTIERWTRDELYDREPPR
jgi:prevent-host-death family protein